MVRETNGRGAQPRICGKKRSDVAFAQNHPLGRHICALPRTAHWHRRGESSGSTWVRRRACEKSALLWTPGIQRRKSGRRRETRKTQHLSTLSPQLSTLCGAYSFPRALLLVDVR